MYTWEKLLFSDIVRVKAGLKLRDVGPRDTRSLELETMCLMISFLRQMGNIMRRTE